MGRWLYIFLPLFTLVCVFTDQQARAQDKPLTPEQLDSLLRIPYHHRTLAVYDSNARFKPPPLDESVLIREEIFPTAGLNKSGSISRGISFGNNQDLFVNSTLNLNMDGKLADDLFIRASITDQNIPFQPEGNTQQLQDFDNVFIQLYNDRFSVTGGDVVFKSKPSHFLKYYKNVQGGLAEINHQWGEHHTGITTLGISVAKGQFASVLIPPLEGVAGPYRIPGPDNRKFIIVLANSEKVFLDGKELVRGFNNDYTIDYNSGELTFSSTILITQFSRIRIDYEYSDQNYSRTITTASHYQTSGRFSLFANVYSEKDNRNRPLLRDLTNPDKQLLSTVGDDPAQAVIPGVDSVGFTDDRILYKKSDTLDLDGAFRSIYVYSTEPDSAFYALTFSDVGEGNGDYRQIESTANGRVYQWVSPEGGQSQGRYEPVVQIAPPNQRQMMTIGGEFKLNDYEKISVETALSHQDLNLYSALDDQDNNGFAIKTGIVSEGREAAFLPGYTFRMFGDVEWDNQHFTPIDRFRSIEYDRDWSYNPTLQQANDTDLIMNTGLDARLDENNGLETVYTIRRRGKQVNGYQYKVALDKRLKQWQTHAALFLMKNKADSLLSDWQRYSAGLSYVGGIFVPGYAFNRDHNRVTWQKNDSVVGSALYYDEHAFYIRNGKASKVDFNLRHTLREDQLPQAGEINPYLKANTTQLTLNKDYGHNSFKTVFTYRKAVNVPSGQTEESIASRLDWRGNWLNRAVKSDLTYTVSNSRELRREFVYIKVPPGEGTHTWRDLNEDGVQDLGEFFEAVNPDERNYAKIFVATDDYLTAFQNLFIYRVRLEMPATWRQAGGIKGFLSRFSNNTSWTSDVKTTDNALGARLLAFAKDMREDALLAEKRALRSTIFYNRSSTTYGADVSYHNTRHKQLLSNGFESRGTEAYVLNTRVNLSAAYSLNVGTGRSVKLVTSDFLANRNYEVNAYEISPSVSFQPTQRYRISAQYRYEDKRNAATDEAGEGAIINEWVLSAKAVKATQTTFNAQLRWVKIDFTGVENSPLGYDLLNALRPGQNITWQVTWQQRITNGLQLNLSYDGRKSEDSGVVHVGRVQVSALF